LNAAGPYARGGTLYCTLEPCSHTGRTGPCTARILEAGVARVVAAIEDPNPMVSGRGFEILRTHGVRVDIGLQAASARVLNQPFATLMREGRPFVILKAAVSADGFISEAPGRRTLLTSAPADLHAHRVRAEVDAIGVGSETILVDDPLLTARGPYRARPLTRVIFDRRLRTPASARVLSTLAAGPVMIVTTAEAADDRSRSRPLQDSGAQLVTAPDNTLASALRLLAAREISSLLLEGGAALHAAAWDEGVADFVRLYVSPRTIGPGGIRFLAGRSFSSDALRERRLEPLGPDVLIEGYVHGPR
jgi:diaminohydroxyphosphoribosylaminopyrimidine deaminase/5-amino-6-(5-phosphoribosylamino)uracil reductase